MSQISRSRRSRVIAMGMSIVGIVALAACTPAQPNQPWPAAGCNGKIAILLDRSASIGDPFYGGSQANVDRMKEATRGVVTAVKDTGATLYIGAFATNADYAAYQTWGQSYSDVPTVTNPFTGGSERRAHDAINAIRFGGTAGDPFYSTYTTPGGVGKGRTNWQGALDMAPAGANLIVLVTDGDPTWRDGADPSTNGGGVDEEDVDFAVQAANRRKAAGARVVAVHAGSKVGGWEDRMKLVSGPVIGEDYFSTDYAGLPTTLRTIASKGCTPLPVTTSTTTTTTTTTRPPAPAVAIPT